MLPVTLAIPFLFIAGVAFGYLVVLPAALHFFQNFNSGQFNVLVQASQYYKFAATTLLAMGLLFQVPVAIIAVTRAGLVTPEQLRHNRRYAVLACGLVAALLPGDAITMLLETVPLYLLFEFSVLVASISERRSAARMERIRIRQKLHQPATGRTQEAESTRVSSQPSYPFGSIRLRGDRAVTVKARSHNSERERNRSKTLKEQFRL